MNILAIVPARKGSKRLPGKNTRPFCGLPLLAHSIKFAQELGLDVVVSTDGEHIASVARSFGADVVMRPEELGRDDTPTMPVLRHAVLREEKRTGKKYDAVLLLQPTSPIRFRKDYERLLEIFGNGLYAATTTDGEVNGVMYLYSWETIVANFVPPLTRKLEQPAYKAGDIDTEDDFRELERRVQGGSVIMPWLSLQDA